MNLFGFDEKILNLRDRAQADVAPQFARIDAIAEHNTQKVLAAFQKNRVAENIQSVFASSIYNVFIVIKVKIASEQIFLT